MVRNINNCTSNNYNKVVVHSDGQKYLCGSSDGVDFYVCNFFIFIYYND